MKMKSEQMIKLIEDTRQLYLIQANYAKSKLNAQIEHLTAQQIAYETIHIQDMESRAYALQLLIEEITDYEAH